MKTAACFCLLLMLSACGHSDSYGYIAALRDLPVGTVVKASDVEVVQCSPPLTNDCHIPNDPTWATDPSQIVGRTVSEEIHDQEIVRLKQIS